jgi:hypothetical protein
VTIDNLPGDVLLEIFDAYRKDMELKVRYEKLWNSNDGWFKLTHVCPRWRHLIHLSPTRLHVHLLFTPRRSSRALMLKNLPPFPVLVDYRASSWTEREENLALAALRHRSRVRRIAIRRPYQCMVKLLRALSHPFPELESLEICPSLCLDSELPILPARFRLLSGSAPCLRRLTLREVEPRYLSPLLSTSTALVELTLSLHTEWGLSLEVLLLSHLRSMSCLRHLDLSLIYQFDTIIPDPPLPAGTGDVIPLSKLAHLIFRGHILHFQALVVGLTAPSLRHPDARLSGSLSNLFPIPHLCKLIRDTECRFTAVRLVFSRSKLEFYARTGSQFVDEPPFRIIIHEDVSLEQMGQELSEPLSTVEDLIIALDDPPFEESHTPSQWRGLFYHLPRVKNIQVSSKEALNVAQSFQQGGQELAMDLLPTLEMVMVDLRHIPIGSDLLASIRGAFKPLIATRQQAGRPIMLL